MILIGPLPATMADVTKKWASARVVAWVTPDGPVMLPRVQMSDGVAATEAEAKAFIADVAWNRLRAERNARLSATDYRVAADAGWDTAPWIAYRQALRDMPKNTVDVLNPVWPSEPQ